MIVKKLLFLTTTLRVGGTEKTLVSYVNKLARLQRYDISILVQFKVDAVETIESEIDSNVHIHYLADSRDGNKYVYLQNNYTQSRLGQCKYVFFRLKYDIALRKVFNAFVLSYHWDTIIHYDTGFPQYLVDLETKAKKIMWIHLSVGNIFKRFFKDFRLKKFVEKLSRFDVVVSICKEMTHQLTVLGVDNVEFLYNPLDWETIRHKSEEFVDLPQGVDRENYIVSVGRLDENQKDFGKLIDAMKTLLDVYTFKVDLVIVGTGRDAQSLKNRSIALGLSDQIHFVGNRSNPYPIIRNSRLLVLSSKFEGLPTVLIEGHILNRLMISSACPTGPAEILEDDDLLVAIGNSDEMAKKIFDVLVDDTIYDNKLETMDKVKAKFYPDAIIEKFERILNS
ncbi:glycosyltransferase [Sphingobacterium sp. UBA6308]|uniref:glycosyltransferase n=1 Tax=Sphingobacterium sp. UBA6308 TaxID=1947508 RepID=UPI00257D1CD0|nr:glycosyltransferase [Sphingobacterium sp. UBA6308]